jgi:hypothetical protein
LSEISDATTILHLCEKVNRRALELNIESQNEGILKLMTLKNELPI